MPAFDPAQVLDLIQAESVSDVLLVPTMIQMLLDHRQFAGVKLASLRRLLYGASPISETTLLRLQAAVPHVELYQAYGMTEVSSVATVLGAQDPICPLLELAAGTDQRAARSQG